MNKETSKERSPSTEEHYVARPEFLSMVRRMETRIQEIAIEVGACPFLGGVPMNGTIIAAMISQRRNWPMVTQLVPEISGESISIFHNPLEVKFLNPCTKERLVSTDKRMLVVVDDVADTGLTIQSIREAYDFSYWEKVVYCVMYKKSWCLEPHIEAAVTFSGNDPWLHFLWEVDDASL